MVMNSLSASEIISIESQAPLLIPSHMDLLSLLRKHFISFTCGYII